MKMLLSISWRSIWRHPARSGVLIGAIVAGLWAGIMVSSWTGGLIVQRMDRLVQEELTHLQVHHPDFLADREPGMFVGPADGIFAWLEGDDRVASFTARTMSDGMIQSPLTTSGVQITGVLTGPERETTTFHENLAEGEYLDADVRNPVLLGSALAEKLNVEIGNRIVLSFQDLENELTSAAFLVTGLYRTGSTACDERHVYVRSEDLTELIAGRPVYHEIAVMLHDIDWGEEVAADLNSQFSEITAETWYELSPELRYLTDAGGSLLFYIMVVIMLALAFGILNTMLMAIFERMREIGMLMAIGMSKLRIFLMIMLESVMLTLTGAAAGMTLAWLNVNWLAERGIDLTAVGGDTLAEWGYDAVVYPVLDTGDFFSITLLVIVTALLAAVYPSIKALRLVPADVVREK